MKNKVAILCVLLSLVSCKVSRDESRSADVDRLLLSEMSGLTGISVSNGMRQQIEGEEVTVYYSIPNSSGRQWKEREVIRRVRSEKEDSTEAKMCEVVQNITEEREAVTVEEEEHSDIRSGYDIVTILFCVCVVFLMLVMCRRAR